MSNIGDKCVEADNSTDCLLRELLQLVDTQAAEYNWDPVNFAFTFILGMGALLFAILAIFQAIMANDSTRRKCNYRAIGDWHKYTKSEWELRGITRIYTVRTPVLMYAMTGSQSPDANHDDPAGTAEEEVVAIGEGKVHSRWKLWHWLCNGLLWCWPWYWLFWWWPWCQAKQVSRDPAASWVVFLQAIGLGEPEKTKASMREVEANYFPSDLVAAPAYAEIGFIVTMAATVGAHTFTAIDHDRYPLIIADSFVFDFRPHPALGVVGCFTKFASPDTKKYNVVPNQWRQRVVREHMSGRIEVGSFCEKRRFHVIGLSSAGDEKAFISIGAPRLIIEKPGGTPHSTRCQCAKSPSHIFSPPAALNLADTPSYVPVLFPQIEMCQRALRLRSLACCSKYWSGIESSPLGLDTRDNPRDNEGVFLLNMNIGDDVIVNRLRVIEDLIRPKEGRKYPNMDLNKQLDGEFYGEQDSESPEFRVICSLVESCTDILKDHIGFKEWFQALETTRKRLFRATVLLQLQQIDEWQKRPEHVTCVQKFLYDIALYLAPIFTSQELENIDTSISTTDKDAFEAYWAGLDDNSSETVRILKKAGILVDCLVWDLPGYPYHGVKDRVGPITDVPAFTEQLLNRKTVLAKMIPAFTKLEPFKGQSFCTGVGNRLLELKRLLHCCRSMLEKGNSTGQAPGEGASEDDIVWGKTIDVMIFRSILMFILFYTAQDSEELRRKVAWNQIVPLI